VVPVQIENVTRRDVLTGYYDSQWFQYVLLRNSTLLFIDLSSCTILTN